MMNNIGLRIRKLREYFELTQNEFSDKIGAKQANLSYIERKGEKISIEIIRRIICDFDIDANWLLTGKGKMLRQPVSSANEDAGILAKHDDYKAKYYDLIEKYAATLEELHALQKNMQETRC
jgi:transcriptional regulator with XRE-family HTH domain